MGVARLNPDGTNDFTFGEEVNYQPYIPDPPCPTRRPVRRLRPT